jgi:glycerophosphoryl diester phosphodiesterase
VRRRDERTINRVGHGGASCIVRPNTLASFDAALDIGVDMLEFDVRAWRGRLILAHTIFHAQRSGCVSLERALAHLAARRFADVELNLDVKHVGCEAAVLDALDRRGLKTRSLVSSQVPAVVAALRSRDRRVLTGISVGGRLARSSRRWTDWRVQVLDTVARGGCDALMAYHRLVDAALVEDVQARGGEVFAWTANSRPTIARLRALEVDGIVTGDPRLFA